MDLERLIEVVAVWNIEREGNGWVLVGPDTNKVHTRTPLSYHDALRQRWIRRVTEALSMFWVGMEKRIAAEIARREVKKLPRRDWRLVVRQYCHWSHQDEWGVRPASDAQQKNNVIMFSHPSLCVARDCAGRSSAAA